LGFKA